MLRILKNNILRIAVISILSLGIWICVWEIPVQAAETEKDDTSFFFELTVDGEDMIEASYGDIITVTLTLNRTDDNNPYTMYAMQDEIRYDSEFFELVENGTMLSSGIASTDIADTDQFREFYMNYLSMSGGTPWNASTVIGTIQLRVIGTSGAAKITSQDFLVSEKDGFGSYSCTANEVTVVVSTECTVKFETRGGSEIPDQKVQYGDKIIRPEDPYREGYHFEGWFLDLDLTDKWDFENDTVQNNMTLYAKWSEETEEEQNVSFNNLAIYFLIFLLFVIICYLKIRRKKNN